MKKMSLLLLSLFALGFLNVSLAGGESIDIPVEDTNAKMANQEWVPPMQTTVTYSFNETGVKNLLAKTGSLLQINCNSSAILQALGFGASSKKLFSIWIEEKGYEYTFDVKNCSLRANKVDANYNYSKSLTEKQAMAFAAAFMKDSYLKGKVYYQLGAPYVVYRNSNGPMYPMMKDASSSTETLSDIEIDTTDTGGDVVPEYTSFSIMYPYLINGQEVREQYGSRIGIQLEVTSDGVMSLNARLLLFKWAKRNSEKLLGDDAVRILKNGGNSPFYSQTSTPIKFAAPQKVLVLFNLRRDNKTYLYLSSGIWLKSSVKIDQYAQQPYTMVLSDYKIGNNVQ